MLIVPEKKSLQVGRIDGVSSASGAVISPGYALLSTIKPRVERKRTCQEIDAIVG
jgi:hypothetical protein